jgi:hypothetical protein
MGVELSVWAKVVADNPRKYKYQGVKGFSKSLVDAILEDDRTGDRYYDDYIDKQVEAMRDDDEYKGMSDDTICDIVNDTFDQSLFKDWLDNTPNLIDKHPPIEVYDAASGDGIPLADVIHFCADCRSSPVHMYDNSVYNYRYCGLCGLESGFLRYDDMVDALEIRVFPYTTSDDEWMVARKKLAAVGEHYAGITKRYIKKHWVKSGNNLISVDNKFIGYKSKRGMITYFRYSPR